MKITKHYPQKIEILAGAETVTCNTINEALKQIQRFLQEGKIVIEIENVSAKIAVMERLIKLENDLNNANATL